jgi:C1A family cysteine protease
MAYSLEAESDYPYTGVNIDTCNYNSSLGVVSVSSYTSVTANSSSALKTAVALGPVAVAIDASSTTIFKSYSSGVISSTLCGTDVDHGVLVVGYGTDASLGDYWILKNSWGTSWGESGYFRLARSSDAGPGICGLQKQPSYPTI